MKRDKSNEMPTRLPERVMLMVLCILLVVPFDYFTPRMMAQTLEPEPVVTDSIPPTEVRADDYVYTEDGNDDA